MHSRSPNITAFIKNYSIFLFLLPLYISLLIFNNIQAIYIYIAIIILLFCMFLLTHVYTLNFIFLLFLIFISAFDQKVFIFRSSEVALYLLSSVILLYYIMRAPVIVQKVKETPLFNLIILFMIVVIISSIQSFLLPYNFSIATTIMQIERWFSFFLLYIIAYTLFSSKKRIYTALFLILLLAFFFSLLSFLDFFSLRGTYIPGLAVSRAMAIFQKPNALAAYLELIVPIPLGLYLFGEKKEIRVLGIILFLFIITAIIMTFTRGAFIGLFLMIVYTFVVARKKLKKLIPLALIVVLMVLVSPLGQYISFRFTPGMFDTSLLLRFLLWKSAINNILQYPLFGIGPGHLAVVFSQEVIQNFKHFGVLGHVHNTYLEIFMSLGIFALVLFILLKYKVISRGVKYISINNQDNITAIVFGIIGGQIAISGHEMFDYFFFSFDISFLYWILIAMLMRLCQNPRKNGLGSG